MYSIIIIIVIIVIIVLPMLVVLSMLVVLMVFVVLPVLVMLVVLVVLVMLVVLVALVVIVRTVVTVVLRVLHVYIMYVSPVAPSYRAVEVIRLAEPLPLSGREDSPELAVSVFPSVGIYVAVVVYAVQIRQVDVQDTVALCLVQSQFHDHLVCDEAGFSPDVCQFLCASCRDHHDCRYDCS